MRRAKLNYTISVLSCICLLLFGGSSKQTLSLNIKAECINGDCSDSIKDCKPPRDYNSENDGCTCFDCEKGTPNQKMVCTRDETDVKTLFALVKKDKENPLRVPPIIEPNN